MKRKECRPFAAVVLVLAPLPVLADSSLQLEWDLRARHEQVDDSGFDMEAQASTLRLRAALRAAFGPGFTAFVEGEGVAAANDHYNSGANGETRYPGVLDPTGTELNQAWLGWKGTNASAMVGRQRIVLDNQRWVGNVGWRQNEQTFDAMAVQWKPMASLTLGYHWLDKVHRVAGDDALNPLARERDLDTHLVNAAWKGASQQVTGYAYLHDDQDVASASTATYGLRWTGTHLRDGRGPGWTVEVARQNDHADNPRNVGHDYWLLEPAWSFGNVTARAGWEHLGGDGVTAVQAPLATLHAFNGWADQFLVTPAGGLEDQYLAVGGKWGRGRLDGKLNWAAAWHDYSADVGGDYGREWNASLGFPLPGGLAGLVKVADYQADGFGRDTTKLWLQVEWRGTRKLTGGAGQ